MDLEGLDVAFLYPSRGLYTLAVDGMDPVLGAAIATAYNRWMYDFCLIAPDRMYGASMVSAFDVESGVTEARASVREQGMKAVFIRPNIVNGRNWHDPYYDPLWEEIESLGVPLGFHEGASARLPQVGSMFETYMMHHTVCHPFNMMMAVVSFIGGGILERFPRLNVGFLEANCGWAPWLLWRLDEHYEMVGRFESPELTQEPREYFLRQCFVSVEVDEEPAEYVESTGLGTRWSIPRTTRTTIQNIPRRRIRSWKCRSPRISNGRSCGTIARGCMGLIETQRPARIRSMLSDK